MEELIVELKQRIIEALNLEEMTPDDIDTDAPLFGEDGLGLDSIDALDLKLRRDMQVELKRIQQRVGSTFIYVTHDQEEALTMSDSIVVMNEGRIQQAGRPELAQP